MVKLCKHRLAACSFVSLPPLFSDLESITQVRGTPTATTKCFLFFLPLTDAFPQFQMAHLLLSHGNEKSCALLPSFSFEYVSPYPSGQLSLPVSFSALPHFLARPTTSKALYLVQFLCGFPNEIRPRAARFAECANMHSLTDSPFPLPLYQKQPTESLSRVKGNLGRINNRDWLTANREEW